jgi:hypothetical protein
LLFEKFKKLALILWVAVLMTKNCKPSIQKSVLFTFEMSKAAAWCCTAVNQNTSSRYLELNVKR